MNFGFLGLILQDYEQSPAGAGLFGGVTGLVSLVVVVLMIAGLWKVFVKAGHPGWACIVPIYNIIVLLKIAGRPLWWFILMLIPFVNIVVAIIVSIDVAKKFGQGAGYGIGLAVLPFIFYPVLGFGSATYQG
jgi:Family of unknown function (DUF5684)